MNQTTKVLQAMRRLDETGDAFVCVTLAEARGSVPQEPGAKMLVTGEGRAFTDEDGRYKFVTIRPGAYPWKNHFNAWRPQHIHFSLFGPAFATRLVTQMYFPGDPLLEFDPIFHSVPEEAARRRMIASFDWLSTEPDLSLGFRFDIVLRGRNATPMGR